MCATGRGPARPTQRSDMRKLVLMATVLVLTGALVGGVSASAVRTINGTPKNDVLRGTRGRTRSTARPATTSSTEMPATTPWSGEAGTTWLSAGRGRTGFAAAPAETPRAQTPPTRSAATAKWSRACRSQPRLHLRLRRHRRPRRPRRLRRPGITAGSRIRARASAST